MCRKQEKNPLSHRRGIVKALASLSKTASIATILEQAQNHTVSLNFEDHCGTNKVLTVLYDFLQFLCVWFFLRWWFYR